MSILFFNSGLGGRVTTPATSQSKPEQAAENILRWFWRYGVNKPGVVGVICYGYVAVIGVIYNVSFYNKHGVDVLDYYDLNDYLLSGLHCPRSLLLSVIIIVLGITYTIMIPKIERKFRGHVKKVLVNRINNPNSKFLSMSRQLYDGTTSYENFSIKYEHFFVFLLSVYLLSFFFITGFMVKAFAERDVSSYLYSPNRRYLVFLKNDENDFNGRQLLYLGSTQRFLFFRNPQGKSLEIVNNQELLRMTLNPGTAGGRPGTAGGWP
jgi:hypothetical protein